MQASLLFFEKLEVGDIAGVKSALAQGADVNEAREADLKTPLEIVCEEGNTEILVYLLSQPTLDLTRQGAFLVSAIKAEQYDIALYLLSHSAVDVNSTNDLNETALIVAATKGHGQLVKELLEHSNIDTHIQSYIFGTALTSATFHKHNAIASELLEYEKIYNEALHPAVLNWAVRCNNIDLVKQLIDKGADVNSVGDIGYIQPPDWVRSEMIKEYINSPFDPNPNNPTFNLPLTFAILNEDEDMVKLLLDHGADPSKKGWQNQSPEDMLEFLDNESKVVQSIKSLLNGAKCSQKENLGWAVNQKTFFIPMASPLNELPTLASRLKDFETDQDTAVRIQAMNDLLVVLTQELDSQGGCNRQQQLIFKQFLNDLKDGYEQFLMHGQPATSHTPA